MCEGMVRHIWSATILQGCHKLPAIQGLEKDFNDYISSVLASEIR